MKFSILKKSYISRTQTPNLFHFSTDTYILYYNLRRFHTQVIGKNSIGWSSLWKYHLFRSLSKQSTIYFIYKLMDHWQSKYFLNILWQLDLFQRIGIFNLKLIESGKQGLQDVKGFHIAYISGTWNPKQSKGIKKVTFQKISISFRVFNENIIIVNLNCNELLRLTLNFVLECSTTNVTSWLEGGRCRSFVETTLWSTVQRSGYSSEQCLATRHS